MRRGYKDCAPNGAGNRIYQKNLIHHRPQAVDFVVINGDKDRPVLRQRAEGSAGRTQSSLSFHSLRHSFNSALANAGVAQELRQKLTGHASKAMNAKYTHHEIDALRGAVALLPSVGIAG